jgi:hypothetical protein
MILEALLLLGALAAGPLNHMKQTKRIKEIDEEIARNNRLMERRGGSR